jgi:hypothetical protein
MIIKNFVGKSSREAHSPLVLVVLIHMTRLDMKKSLSSGPAKSWSLKVQRKQREKAITIIINRISIIMRGLPPPDETVDYKSND